MPLSRVVGRAFGIAPVRYRAARAEPPGPVGSVLVVGGGIAGVSAAVVLAERGIPVTLLEGADRLGGRLGTETHRLAGGGTQPVDHGFHGFFRQYYNWRAVLRRIDGGERLLRPLGSYPVMSRRWPDEQFDGLPSTPPVSVAALVLRSPSLRIRELVRANHELARQLLAYDPVGTHRALDGVSAAEFLGGLGLTPRASAMLFNVFAHSFFNHAEEVAAADLVAMFHFYFLGNPEGLGMDAPTADYGTAIWSPLAEHLARHGARVELSSPVTELRPAGGRWRAGTPSGALEADRVVLAVDAASVAALLASSPALTAGDPGLAWLRDNPLAGPPYAVARYWMSGDVHADRAPFTSIGDAGLLDSVTLYHRIEDAARGWHRRTGGAVLELHAYAGPDGTDPEVLGRRMLDELVALWPEVAALRPVDGRCRVGHDAAGFPTSAAGHRPGVRTALEGLSLAGDWVGLPVPSALMERAATTGILAANGILERAGKPPEPVWSVPPRGLLARRTHGRPAAVEPGGARS